MNDKKEENDNRITEVVDNRVTEVVDNRITEVVDNRITEVVDNRVTEVVSFDNDSVILKKEEIKRTKIDAGDIIGNGYLVGRLLSETSGEADVHLCKKGNEEFVAKIYKKSVKLDESAIKTIQEINSPFVVKPIEVGYVNDRYYEIMPYYKNGSLFDDIKNISKEFLIDVVIPELNEALKAIHDKKLCHNDIKPHNLFFSNDKKHILVGDFGTCINMHERDYLTRTSASLTLSYAAPEARETTSKRCDYYSFGVTLLHLALKKDPFAGIPNNQVRQMILNFGQHISKDVDPQLADLIAKLTMYDPNRRGGYEDVIQWMDNKNVFLHIREVDVESANRINPITIKINGESYTIDNVKDLVETFSNNWNTGLEYYEEGFIEESIKLTNQALYLQLKNARKKLPKEKYDVGLFLALRELYPFCSFSFKGINYETFAKYVLNLEDTYPKCDESLLDKEVLLYIAKYENFDDNVEQRIEEIFNTYTSKQDILDIFLLSFSERDNIYLGGKKYSLSELCNILFDKNNKAKSYSLLSQKLFYRVLAENYNNIHILELWEEKDLFKRYCKMSILIRGNINNRYEEALLKNLYDYLKLIEEYYSYVEEGNHKGLCLIRFFDKIFKDNILTKIAELEENIDIPKIIDSYSTTIEKVQALYFSTSDSKMYLKCKDINALSYYIQKNNNIDETCKYILNDNSFYMWLRICKGINIEKQNVDNINSKEKMREVLKKIDSSLDLSELEKNIAIDFSKVLAKKYEELAVSQTSFCVMNENIKYSDIDTVKDYMINLEELVKKCHNVIVDKRSMSNVNLGDSFYINTRIDISSSDKIEIINKVIDEGIGQKGSAFVKMNTKNPLLVLTKNVKKDINNLQSNDQLIKINYVLENITNDSIIDQNDIEKLVSKNLCIRKKKEMAKSRNRVLLCTGFSLVSSALVGVLIGLYSLFVTYFKNFINNDITYNLNNANIVNFVLILIVSILTCIILVTFVFEVFGKYDKDGDLFFIGLIGGIINVALGTFVLRLLYTYEIVDSFEIVPTIIAGVSMLIIALAKPNIRISSKKFSAFLMLIQPVVMTWCNSLGLVYGIIFACIIGVVLFVLFSDRELSVCEDEQYSCNLIVYVLILACCVLSFVVLQAFKWNWIVTFNDKGFFSKILVFLTLVVCVFGVSAIVAIILGPLYRAIKNGYGQTIRIEEAVFFALSLFAVFNVLIRLYPPESTYYSVIRHIILIGIIVILITAVVASIDEVSESFWTPVIMFALPFIMVATFVGTIILVGHTIIIVFFIVSVAFLSLLMVLLEDPYAFI